MAISPLLRTMLAQFLVGCLSVRQRVHTKVMEGLTNARSMGSEPDTASNRGWDGEFRGKFGVDVGGVLNIHYRDLPRGTEWWTDVKYVAPDAMEGLSRIIEIFGPENVFIVSRADDRVQDYTNAWFSKLDIFQKTGLLEKNVRYTEFDEKLGGKGEVASELELTHFIDDTWTCIDSVFDDISYTVGNARKYIEKQNGLLLFFQRSGAGTELPECPDYLPQGIEPYLKRVTKWKDALSLIEANVGMAALTDPSIDNGCGKAKKPDPPSVDKRSDVEEQITTTTKNEEALDDEETQGGQPTERNVTEVAVLADQAVTPRRVVKLIRHGLTSNLDDTKPTLLFEGSVYKESQRIGSNHNRWVEVISFKDGNQSLLTCLATRKAQGKTLRDLFFVSSATDPTRELIGGGFFKSAQEAPCTKLKMRKLDIRGLSTQVSGDIVIPASLQLFDLDPLRFCGEEFVEALPQLKRNLQHQQIDLGHFLNVHSNIYSIPRLPM